jgi:transcriptional regulator with GAF, ATPase, and Fis domain
VGIHTAEVSAPRGVGAARLSAPAALDQILCQTREAFVCDAASVLGRSSRGALELMASSESDARRADQLQLSQDECPALSVCADGDICLSGDTSIDERWPRWGPAMARLGWFSVLSAPLVTPEQDLGVLNLYSRRPFAFDATHAYAARIFAQYAATALAYATETEGLRDAITSRHRVGLAQGILMKQYGVDAEGAFDMLRRYSQANNVKLRTVAEQVVATGSFPTTRVSRGRQRSKPAA